MVNLTLAHVRQYDEPDDGERPRIYGGRIPVFLKKLVKDCNMLRVGYARLPSPAQPLHQVHNVDAIPEVVGWN